MKQTAKMTTLVGSLHQAADRVDEIAAGLRGLAEYGQSQNAQSCNDQLISSFEKRMEHFAEQLKQVLPLLRQPQ